MPTKHTTGTHDGPRHSTAHTELREALEGWDRFRREAVDRIFGRYGGQIDSTGDPERLRQLARETLAVARTLASVLERLHWPKWDQANSRLSDERAFQQADRHLRDGHPELAWGLAFSALTHADEWKDAPGFKDLGIDLCAYFRAEADATLRVLMQHHLNALRGDHADQIDPPRDP